MYFGLGNSTLAGFEIVTSCPPMLRVVDSLEEGTYRFGGRSALACDRLSPTMRVMAYSCLKVG